MGTDRFSPETSGRDCHHSLRNDPEECSSQLHRDGSLEPHTMNFSLRKDSVAHARLPSSAWICLNSQCASSSGQADSATWYRSAMAYVITEPLWRHQAGFRIARFVTEELSVYCAVRAGSLNQTHSFDLWVLDLSYTNGSQLHTENFS